MDILTKILNENATIDDQEEALKNPSTAFYFAFVVLEANIEKCQKVACKDPYWAMSFACNIKGANINECIKTCRGTEYEDKLNEVLMEKALK